MKRALKLVAVAGIAVGLGLMLLMQAAAQQAVTTTRSFSPDSVPAGGGEVTVTIDIAGPYGVGSVTETLPTGFSLVTGSVTPSDITLMVTGQQVSFALLGETSFSYKVNPSDQQGTQPFTGELVYGLGKTRVTVSEPTSLTLTAPSTAAVSATRSFNPDSVPAGGGEVTVTIDIAGPYGVGSVTETLPTGFSLVTGSVTPSDITLMVTGQQVSFALLGETSFSYKVNPSDQQGTQPFTGELVYGLGKTRVTVSEPTSLTLTAPSTAAVSATRSFSPDSVPAGGGEVTVTIDIAGPYGVGSVTETLPTGFSLVTGSVTPSDITLMVTGQQVSFALLGETSFSYKVNPSDQQGTQPFTGELVYGLGKTRVTVSEPTSLTLTAPSTAAVSATRSFSPDSVPAGGDEVTVTIDIAGPYGVGSVTETLPTGFSLVTGSVTPSDITLMVTGQQVSFALLGETSFSYKVNPSDQQGTQPFTGELVYGLGKTRVTVSEPTSLTLTAPSTAAVSATRSFSPDSVPAGGDEVTVTIDIAGPYGVGSVTETLPTGFSLVTGSVTPSDITLMVTGQQVSFALLGETSFSYKVDTVARTARYRFSGELIYSVDRTTVTIGGSSRVTVGRPVVRPPSRPTPTATPRRRTGGGSTRRDPTATATPRPRRTATPMPTPTPTPETGMATPTPMPTPTATPTPTPTPTAVPAPVATPTPSPRLPSTGDTLPLWLVPLAVLGLLLAIGGALLVANQLLRPKDPRPGHRKSMRG